MSASLAELAQRLDSIDRTLTEVEALVKQLDPDGRDFPPVDGIDDWLVAMRQQLGLRRLDGDA